MLELIRNSKILEDQRNIHDMSLLIQEYMSNVNLLQFKNGAWNLADDSNQILLTVKPQKIAAIKWISLKLSYKAGPLFFKILSEFDIVESQLFYWKITDKIQWFWKQIYLVFKSRMCYELLWELYRTFNLL